MHEFSNIPTKRYTNMEVNLQEFREGSCFYSEVKSWLEPQGFQIVWHHIWDTMNMSWQGNVLFVRG